MSVLTVGMPGSVLCLVAISVCVLEKVCERACEL